jgi:hypothetical protein
VARRVNMPKADDLFRPTAVPDAPPDIHIVEPAEAPFEARKLAPQDKGPQQEAKSPSGRVKHDEKMTVYITQDELLDLEHARLILRRTLGSAVDRGKLVRAAVAIALADLEANGEGSALVQRLIEA